MAPPLYFFPLVRLAEILPAGKPALSPAALARYGLEYILGDVPAGNLSRQDMTAAGPGGKSGSMVCANAAGGPPHRFGFFPDLQEWTLVRAEPELWIGLDRESRPGPADLARGRLLDGYPVQLADGNTWQVPVVRSPDQNRATSLPRDLWEDAAGQMHLEIKPSYQAAWEASQRAWDAIYGETDEERSMAYSQILGLCYTLLGLNYRFGRYEQAVLRLIDTEDATWGEIFRAAVDVPFVRQYVTAQKKTGTQTGQAGQDPSPPAIASTPPGGPA